MPPILQETRAYGSRDVRFLDRKSLGLLEISIP